MSATSNSTLSTFEYKIKRGDNLSTLIATMYKTEPGSARYRKIFTGIRLNNPHITDPNFIRTGDILVLVSTHSTAFPSAEQPQSPLRVSRPNHLSRWPTDGITEIDRSTPFYHNGYPHRSIEGAQFDFATYPPVSYHPPFATDAIDNEERDLFWALSWLAEGSNYITTPAGIFGGTASNLLNPANTKLINSVADIYADYQNGLLTKGQYDYKRKLMLEKLSKNLGPTEKWLFNGKTTKQSIRIARAGAIPATQHIQGHATRLTKLAKMGSRGGILLAGVGVAASCVQIKNTKEVETKNDIIVETLASTTVGLAASAAVTVFLVSNPVGWGAALLLATGTAAASIIAGQVAKDVYDATGRPVDLYSGFGIDKVCK